jgi:hypothetical protein
MKCVLRPGGSLLLALHIGDDVLHLDEWWGQNVSVDFIFFRPDEHQSRRPLSLARSPVNPTLERPTRNSSTIESVGPRSNARSKATPKEAVKPHSVLGRRRWFTRGWRSRIDTQQRRS